ncbi:MAG: DNA polymerase IV [Actinomycetales bacterium]|nr:DNA polymerase IV [Actinomycetales bacterium]
MATVKQTIIHCDMDAFYASVAELDDPTLRGKPVVVGAGIRGVVLSANYPARKFGIRAAMPVGRAKRMAPNAIFVTPDHHRYAEISAKVMEIFESFTPYVEPLSLDEAFMDVTGAQKLLGTPREIGQAIRKRVHDECGITCSVGIASNKFIAKLASGHCKPNGLLEIPDDRVISFLHPLPVRDLWGVGPKTAEQLERLGLHQISDIANTPLETLKRALGDATGEHLYELSWGRDFRTVVVDDPEQSIGANETFSYDMDDPEAILREYLKLTERASTRLRNRNLFAKTISITVRFADFKTITRSKTLPLPISSTHEIYQVVKDLYEALKLDRARLRLVGVSLSNLRDDAPEQLMLGQREKGWREAESAVDKAAARFGERSVRPARLYKPKKSE